MTDRRVAIVTDSTSDLPPALATARSISIVPLTLNFDGQALLDGVDITPSEFYRRLPNATSHPTTSQPSPGQFAEVYSALLADHDAIVSVHISEKLSGTFESAQQAADMTDATRVEGFEAVGALPRIRSMRPMSTTSFGTRPPTRLPSRANRSCSTTKPFRAADAAGTRASAGWVDRCRRQSP